MVYWKIPPLPSPLKLIYFSWLDFWLGVGKYEWGLMFFLYSCKPRVYMKSPGRAAVSESLC